MRTTRVVALLVLGVLMVPAAQAAINRPIPYEAQFPYMPGFVGASFTMTSGALQASMASAQGTLGFFTSGGVEIAGISKACWFAPAYQCATSATNSLHILVLPGGSFGIQLPGTFDATVQADHALAMFADLKDQGDLNSLSLSRSMVAPLVSGTVALSSIGTIPTSTLNTPQGTGAGAVAATDLVTTLEVRDGATLKATLRDKAQPIQFAGLPTVTPVQCEMAVVPFVGAAATAHFTPAGHAAAAKGLNISRINDLMSGFYGANRGSETKASAIDAAAFGPFQDAATALFSGAVLNLPASNATSVKDSLSFARITTLTVHGTPANTLAWSGKARLDIHGGHVAGAKKMYGFAWLTLPWWSWLLWVVAIGVWITRLVLRPEKHHATWDRFRWVGWVASPLAYLLVLLLWDFEIRATLGLSLLSGNSHGQVLLLVAAFELATFAALSFAAIAPLRMLLRNGSLLLRQGTFMGIAGAVASLLGFLLGVTYLRSYMDVLVSQLIAAVS